MLDGNDKETFHALRLLRDLVSERRKPLVIWAGAGVSMWCGFPSWEEAASRLQSDYRKFEAKYNKVEGQLLFEQRKYPELFEILRRTNPQRYRQGLASMFTSRGPTAVYRRFLDIANAIQPLQVVTTNVDEMLEHHLSVACTVQRSDIERCVDLLPARQSFVAKLHGSISSVESAVFAISDYEGLLRDAVFIETLRVLFAQASVLFIGYSLRDQYVLDLLAANSGTKPLFGDGPHFLVASAPSPAQPDSIKAIRYVPEPHADHRSAITALDIVRTTRDVGPTWFLPESNTQQTKTTFDSAYFLTDITPPGTWTSSQSLTLARPGEPIAPNAIVGQGFDNSEVPNRVSTAMHDLIVGLVSFDHVYIPLSHAGRLHQLIGAAPFWDLVRGGVFRFIYFEDAPVMIFRSVEAPDGGTFGVCHAAGDNGQPSTADEQIRRQIQPVKGREAEAAHLLEVFARHVDVFDKSRFNIPNLTRGALLHPSVQRLLGISDAIVPTSIPRWLTFPVLRLAHTIMAGCACENFALAATKIGFGSEVLAGAAFAASAARDWADDVSSYVVTGRFNSDLGAYVEANPSVWATVLTFRDTQAGINLRSQILQAVAANAGADLVASVNGGLRRIVPTSVMEAAHSQLTELMVRVSRSSPVVPAVWTNVRNSDEITRLWRARSRRELDTHCRKMGIRPKDLCPCGSGEKLRDCCARSLSL